MEMIIKKVLMLILLSFIPATTDAKDYLPTVFWNPNNPALNRQQWSKVVNVNLFQTLTFLCPTNLININRVEAPNPNTESYYNLYVREISSSERNLDYNSICDTTKSKEVFFCNESRSALTLTPETYKRFQINTKQAQPTDPEFKYGKDYIFFSTSNGRQETLRTNSTQCTMVFRIHLCKKDEKCSISKCSTYGRDEVCLARVPEFNTTSPRDVEMTAVTTSSMTISWKEPQTIASNITYYSICYRKSLIQACRTKIVESQTRSAILENLDSSTNYKIRVRAHTSIGPGPYSMDISQNTKKFNTTAPRDVGMTAVTTSSLTISWKEPWSTASNITYYSICYRKSLTQDCLTKIVESQTRSTVLENLDSSTNYKIRMRAHTSIGPGRYSMDISHNTKDVSFISSEPKKVAVSDITYSSAKLTWQAPDSIEEDVVYYKICCRESAKQECVYKLAESHSESIVVNDLKASTEYNIHIRPYTSKGLGNPSKEILFNTTAVPEEGITSAQCSDSTIHYISLIIGIVIGAVVILLVVFVKQVCGIKQRPKAVQDRKNDAYRNSNSTQIDCGNNNEKDHQTNNVELNSFP